jgi:hypothetical protein
VFPNRAGCGRKRKFASKTKGSPVFKRFDEMQHIRLRGGAVQEKVQMIGHPAIGANAKKFPRSFCVKDAKNPPSKRFRTEVGRSARGTQGEKVPASPHVVSGI